MIQIHLVEDDSESAERIIDILGEEFAFWVFPNGPSLFGYLFTHKTEPPDLFLINTSLPRIDGLAVLRELRTRQDWAHTPALALASRCGDDDRERYFAAGFNGCVRKPIEVEDVLREEVSRVLTEVSTRSS